MATYLDELVQKITTKADLKGFDDLDRKQKRAIKSNDLLAKSFRRAFGIFFGIQGIRSIIQTTRDLDLLQKSIKGLTGSVEDWQFLRQEAYRTGTSLKTIAGAYKNFYSAARGSGFNGNQIQGMFSGLLTAGRGIGASQQQIGGALVALEQMLSKGKVSAEELRKQLGNALPGAVEIAQRAMGVTGAEFEEMMKKGISAAEFVPKFIAQAEKELGKGFKENIKSLDFALVNLNTAWMEFQANILHGEAGEALAQLARDMTKILRSQELLRFIQLIGKALAFVIKHIKTLIVLWGFNKFIKMIAFLRQTHTAISGVSKVVRILSLDVGTLSRYIRFLNSTGGLGSMAKNIGAAAKATALLYGQWFALLGVIFMIQDVITWLSDRDETTKTWTGFMLGRGKDTIQTALDLNKPSIRPLALSQQAEFLMWKKAHPGTFADYMQFDDFGFPRFKNVPQEFFNGGNANYSNSRKENNNISYNPTININGSNLSEERISAIFEKENLKFLTLAGMNV